MGRGKIQASKNRTRVILGREEQGGGEEKQVVKTQLLSLDESEI